MMNRAFPPIRRQLIATSVTEVFEPFTSWFNSLEAANALVAVLILANKTNDFQCRFGLQTATTIIQDTNTPGNPTAASTQITTAPTRTFLRFDPNAAANGNIDAAAYFRVGCLYSLIAGSTTTSQGDVELQGLAWY